MTMDLPQYLAYLQALPQATVAKLQITANTTRQTSITKSRRTVAKLKRKTFTAKRKK